jgi:hypothetical protein
MVTLNSILKASGQNYFTLYKNSFIEITNYYISVI